MAWTKDARRQLTVAAVAVGSAAVARILLQPVLQQRAVFLLFILAVAVSSHYGGLLAGLASTVLGGVCASILFLELLGPTGMQSESVVQLALFTTAAIPISILGGRLRGTLNQLQEVLQREHRWRTAERVSRTEAERANRLKDEFLAVLSHELRTPLNAIAGWGQVLQGMELPTEAARAVDTIVRNANHQAELIAEISDVSRSMTGKLALEASLVDVRAVLEQAVDAVRLAAEARGVRLQMTASEMPLLVRGDGHRLQQVFWNLLSNAIKFSDAGASVQTSTAREADRAVVIVSDTGRGIGPDFLPYVFDSFRQEDPSKSRRQGGLGLGLSIVRHLTEAHGGTVEAASDGPGRGAIFTVRLPLAAGVSVETAPAFNQTPPLTGIRIMIVDDDQDTRELLVRALRDLGADVFAAASAAEARGTLAAHTPDAIVSDLGMPGEDGLTFMRQLRRRPEYRNLPAIAVTAYSSVTDRIEALDAGYHDHITKPVHPDRLARALVAALRRPA